MFRERDMCCADPQDQRGVDLKMSVFRGNILRVHGNEKILFLFSINELNQSTLEKRVDIDFLSRQFRKVFTGDEGFTVLQDDKRAAGPATVGENHDIPVVFLV